MDALTAAWGDQLKAGRELAAARGEQLNRRQDGGHAG